VAEARDARDSAVTALDTLVVSGRWSERMRDQVLVLLDGCGPQQQLIGAS
jgi:hypothetical protein